MLHVFNFTIKVEKRTLTQKDLLKEAAYNNALDDMEKMRQKVLYEANLYSPFMR